MFLPYIMSCIFTVKSPEMFCQALYRYGFIIISIIIIKIQYREVTEIVTYIFCQSNYPFDSNSSDQIIMCTPPRLVWNCMQYNVYHHAA